MELALLARPFTFTPHVSLARHKLSLAPQLALPARPFPAASLIRRSSLGTPSDDVLPMLTLLLCSALLTLLPTVMIIIITALIASVLLCSDCRPTPQIA